MFAFLVFLFPVSFLFVVANPFLDTLLFVAQGLEVQSQSRIFVGEILRDLNN